MINPQNVAFVCENPDKKTCTIGVEYPGFDSKGRPATLIKKEIVPLKDGHMIAKAVAAARQDIDKYERELEGI